MTDNLFTSDEHAFFTMLPNYVDELGLSPIAFRLYVHIRRVTGEDGICWQSTSTLANICKVSRGSIVAAKKELSAVNLISITSRKSKDGGKDYHEVRVIDIWQKNRDYFETKASSIYELASSAGERTSSAGDMKEEPSKKRAANKNPKNKGRRSAPPSPPTSESTSSIGGYKGDTTSKFHPAIQAIKDVTDYYPPKTLYEPIINFLGDNPDKEKLRRNFTLWVAQGYNPMHYDGWLFDWYKNDAYYTNPNDKEILSYLPGGNMIQPSPGTTIVSVTQEDFDDE